MDATILQKLQRSAAFVKVEGPDPKLVKARASPFYSAASGATSLSASGTLLPLVCGAACVLAPAHVLVPFLHQRHRAALSSASHAGLLQGARIWVACAERAPVAARLEGFFCVDGAADALSRVTQGGSDWSASWLLGAVRGGLHGRQPLLPWVAVLSCAAAGDETDAQPTDYLRAAPLRHAANAQQQQVATPGYALQPGCAIYGMGSPFGAVSPQLFSHHVAAGIVANTICGKVPVVIPASGLLQAFAAWQAKSGAQPPSRLNAPPAVVRPAPAVPAAKAASSPAGFAQLLAGNAHRAAPWDAGSQQQLQPAAVPALARRSTAHQGSTPVSAAAPVGNAVHLRHIVAPARVAAPAVCMQQCQHGAAAAPDHGSSPPERSCVPAIARQAAQRMQQAVAEACQGVVALLTGSGAWATGVAVAGDEGQGSFIVTNAHLVSQRGQQQGRQSSRAHPVGSSESGQKLRVQIWHRGAPDAAAGCPLAPRQQQQRPEWHSAVVVYIFRGPLDLAVLQLKDQGALHGLRSLRLSPRGGAGASAAAGEPVAVVGFPLFSPCRCFGPFASAGIVTKVVSAEQSAGEGAHQPAAMLITNATVHPGASGGAVVGANGCLVGLVTSNARHTTTGATLPNLNFCLAADALRPLWSALAAPQHEAGEMLRSRLAKLDFSDHALSSMWALAGQEGPKREKGQAEAAGARLQKLLREKGVVGDIEGGGPVAISRL